MKHNPWWAAVESLALVSLLIFLPAARAQSPAASPAPPKFDVASVKPAPPSARGPGRLAAPPVDTKPGLLTARSASLQQLLRAAYSVENFRISGGPGWIDSERFDVDAKSDGAADRGRLLLMLRALLADRFKLAFHRENRELNIYNLVVSKVGPKFHALKPEVGPVRAKTNHLRMKDLPSLATYLTRLSTDAPVFDKTGLTGQFDLDLDMSKIMAEAQQGGETAGPDAMLARIFDATANALQDELGLKLVPAKAPVEVLVIDHAEKPASN